jgi:hypothetical protein
MVDGYIKELTEEEIDHFLSQKIDSSDEFIGFIAVMRPEDWRSWVGGNEMPKKKKKGCK